MQKPWEIDLTIYEDEVELVAGLRRSDRMACTCLLKRYAPRLYRLALHMMGEADEAEDVLQEAFIQACAHVSDFAGRSGLGTWLHRIVLNTALMRLRRKHHDIVSLDASLEEGLATALEPLSDRTEPDAQVLNLELRGVLDRAVRTLPDSLRVAFVLRDIEGLSTREAAEALEIAESALKVRLHRARLMLREALASYVGAADDLSKGEQ